VSHPPDAPSPPAILVASFNPGKAAELRALLAAAGYAATTLAEAGVLEPFEESAAPDATYEANGLGKARHYARLSGRVTIADDSGLEVEALGGGPGPLSARYGGEGLDDAARNRLILEALRGLSEERRAARYVAVAVVARPDGAARAFRGECAGHIAAASSGAGGFGYDPIFFDPRMGKTFAEIPPEHKHAVSHRGRAFAALAEFLSSEEGRRFIAAGAPGATA
jgi:XTP/dITP diphosphohydrolase